jgi:(2Fe-2S) ferredoxin
MSDVPCPSATSNETPQPRAPGQSPYERHVFVCTSGKTCPDQGSVELHEALKLAARDACGPVTVRVNKSGCLSQCGFGPMVVVYPDNVWYAGVAVADVSDIVTEHLVGGRPVERLLFRGHVAGKNVK